MNRWVRVATAVVGGAVLLSGCGGSDSSSAGSEKTPSPTRSASSTPSQSASATARASASASSSPAGVPECRSADLSGSLSGGDGAMGTTYFRLALRNVSEHPCRTGGYGGVSLVARAGGSQLGAPADRTPARVRSLVLIPNAHATARLGIAQALNYPKADCRPAPAAGLRVYPPDETRSLFVAHTGITGCGLRGPHLLHLSPYRPGH